MSVKMSFILMKCLRTKTPHTSTYCKLRSVSKAISERVLDNILSSDTLKRLVESSFLVATLEPLQRALTPSSSTDVHCNLVFGGSIKYLHLPYSIVSTYSIHRYLKKKKTISGGLVLVY